VHRARALAALVAGICVASTPAALAAPPTSDDFDRANLDLGLWTFVNPLGDGSLRMVGAGTGDAVVELSIPDGASHDPWQVNRSVRIMQPADDADFEVEVWFQSEPALRYQMQGVIVEQDADNWLRFEFLHDGSGLSVFAARTVGGSSSSAFDFGIDTGDAGAMRLTRTGDDWSVSYLDGGTTWQPAGGFTQALAVSALGPYVANHANTGDSPGFTAVIDAFQNTASPISPEDDGAPADNDPPFVHAAATAVTGADELTVLFATDEPATGTVRIGTTTAYELGDFAGAAGLTSHAIAIPGLVVGQTYHYLIEAEDGIGNAGSTADMVIEFTQPGAPVIDIWYGDTQAFGALGQAQPWVNILGRVSDPDGDLAGLTYSLNGAMPTVELSVGPDGRRLENIGDFNVDLATADLDPGANSVVITATDSIGNVAERTVTVDYTPGTVWPLPYDADWSGLAATDEIQGVGQVVDGLWGLEQIDTGPGRALETFVRSIEPGYDRLLAVGDRTWTDYEFEVPIVMNSQPGGYGVGVLLRWDGHTDNPVAGWQPKTGYLPLGCILWARPGKIELYGNGGDILDSQSRTLSIGTVYVFKGRVETVAGVGGLYSMKVWELGQPEPAGWDITGQESLTDPQAGSPLLIAHQADASFGPVTITSLVPGPDVTPPVITDVQIDPSRTTARLSWTTDEAADSLVEYGETTAYGSEASSASLVLSHEIELTGLDPDTTYQCRISSTDPSDNTGTTANLEFTTDPTTEVASIVSDEFNQPQLDGSVWTFINAPDPPADGTLAMTGTQASLGVPAGVEHQVWIDGGERAAHRAVRERRRLRRAHEDRLGAPAAVPGAGHRRGAGRRQLPAVRAVQRQRGDVRVGGGDPRRDAGHRGERGGDAHPAVPPPGAPRWDHVDPGDLGQRRGVDPGVGDRRPARDGLDRALRGQRARGRLAGAHGAVRPLPEHAGLPGRPQRRRGRQRVRLRDADGVVRDDLGRDAAAGRHGRRRRRGRSGLRRAGGQLRAGVPVGGGARRVRRRGGPRCARGARPPRPPPRCAGRTARAARPADAG
jgi:regulation of enolase protein 1 (concanavalin A-like superfamily)